MTSAARLPIPDLSRAVLIGTSDYRHADRLPALPAVRNNLTDLLVALTAPDTGILTRQRCTTIDTPDTPDSFLDRLHTVADQAQDLLVVYYGGHGLLHETKDDVLYLTVRQTNPKRPAGNAVPFSWVREAIQHSPARTKLLILDCCYSGAAIGAMSGNAVNPRDIEVSGTCVITSSPWNKISHSPRGDQHTAFTGELIRLLLHGSPIEGEPLTVPALYRGLRAALANRQLPLPKLQATDSSVDLLLRRTPGAEPPRTTLPPPEAEPTQPPLTEPDNDTGTPRADAHTGSAGRQWQAPPPPPRTPPGSGAGVQPGWLRYVRATLWFFTVFGFGMLIGGLVGANAGKDEKLIQEDQQSALYGAIAFVVGAALLIMLRARGVKYSTMRPAPQPRWLAKLSSTWALVVLLALSLLFAIAVPTNGEVTPEQGSALALDVGGAIVFGSSALACALALLRRITR